jgi:hypothetical protein
MKVAKFLKPFLTFKTIFSIEGLRLLTLRSGQPPQKKTRGDSGEAGIFLLILKETLEHILLFV